MTHRPHEGFAASPGTDGEALAPARRMARRNRVAPLTLALALALAAMMVLISGARADAGEARAGGGEACGATLLQSTDGLLNNKTDPNCPGVRPGATLRTGTDLTRDYAACTFAFLFTGSDGNRYVASAGHCAGGSGQWGPGEGPVAYDGDLERVGEWVWSSFDLASEPQRDFSLIRLDPGVEASPRVCHWGGPTAINRDVTSSPVSLRLYGQGIGSEIFSKARGGYAPQMDDPDEVTAYAVVSGGDSGAPWTSADGRAIGVTSRINSPTSEGTSGSTDGTAVISRLGPSLAEAERDLGVTLTLQTAPELR